MNKNVVIGVFIGILLTIVVEIFWRILKRRSFDVSITHPASV